MFFLRVLAFVAGLGFAGPTLAQTAAQTTPAPAPGFRLGGMEFSVPPPAGYCAPKGVERDVLQLLAAADSDNVTHLGLVRCDKARGFDKDYFLIKTPRTVLNIVIPRSQLIPLMAAEFRKPEFVAMMNSDSLQQEASKSVTETLNAKVDLKGRIVAMGEDEVCAYLGGIGNVKGAGQEYVIAWAGCTTAVADRMVSVYHYAEGSTIEQSRALLPKVRSVVEAMSARPADGKAE
jgi:hypothetical protein